MKNQAARRLALLAGAVFIGTLGLGCDVAPSPSPKASAAFVIVIVLDSASAAYFGAYGGAAGTTPHVDRLASQSVVFEQAYSQSASTLTSTASLITGVRGTTHAMHGRTTLPRELRTAAEMLAEAGFQTTAVIANPWAGAPPTGLDRGYRKAVRVYDKRELRGHRAMEKSSRFLVVLPDDVNQELFPLLEELAELHAEGIDSFTYVHYLQPHMPYDPPARFRRGIDSGTSSDPLTRGLTWDELHDRTTEANRTGSAPRPFVEELEARYRANLSYADGGVGALLERLEELGLFDESLIVLLSDHGDAFFGHALFGHNKTLYDDMTRIPLLVKFPRRAVVRPRRVSVLVETIDVLPTIFDFLGLPLPEQFEGDTLWPLVRDVVAEHLDGDVVLSTLSRKTHAIRVGDEKYILHRDGRGEFYDLRQDPGEQHDRSAEAPERARELRRRLLRVVEASGSRREGQGLMRADPEMQRLLESLGYADDGVWDDDASDRPD